MKQVRFYSALALIAAFSMLPLSNEAQARGGVFFSGGVVEAAPAYPPYYTAYPAYAYPPPAYYAPPPSPAYYAPPPAYGYAPPPPPPVAYGAPIVGGVGVRF